MSRCEHGIVPVTDCYVCVSPKRGEEMTDYHELPEVPRCCLTCAHLRNKHRSMLLCINERVDINNRRLVGYASVAPHGLCSHWERRDDGG